MAAWEQLYLAHGHGLLHRIIRPRVSTLADAEDVLAATFMAAFEGISRYVDQGRPFAAWLTRIAINRCTDVHRRHQATATLDRLPTDDRSPLPLADTLIGRYEDARRATEQVTAVLAGLNPRYAEALTRRLLDGQSREDCATALGTSVATFDVVLLRATRAFRAEWQRQFGDENTPDGPAQEPR
ncbi:MAG: sigma-70 family RNA polymerase sigma factor [Myxococcales bacterium]|nr:sigma-70 family RNA polymerase sigma factor [Myxococcales bacterium]